LHPKGFSKISASALSPATISTSLLRADTTKLKAVVVAVARGKFKLRHQQVQNIRSVLAGALKTHPALDKGWQLDAPGGHLLQVPTEQRSQMRISLDNFNTNRLTV